jgi:hypothetical protein
VFRTYLLLSSLFAIRPPELPRVVLNLIEVNVSGNFSETLALPSFRSEDEEAFLARLLVADIL